MPTVPKNEDKLYTVEEWKWIFEVKEHFKNKFTNIIS